MKFPYELSYERLSLLSEEDRKIYDIEHSGLYNLEAKIVPNIGFINEDVEVRKILDKQLFETEFDSLLDKEIIEAVGVQEYIRIKANLFDFIENDPELQGELFEAPGHAADWWLPEGLKLGWLGKLAAGLLTGLLGIAAWLFMKGKDRLAMKKLKQYMNRLVELIDMGINKKRPWYSFLMASKKNRNNTGDFNKACFRTIQETAERNMACLYTQCVHNLGFFNPGITDFRGITSGMMPDEGSGLDNFRRIIIGNVGDLNMLDDLKEKNSEKENYIKLLPIQPDLSKFYSLKLPALPTNYTMLMCNIEYPAKSDKNPNGSLFMKPTQEILQAKAEDLGLTYFSEKLDVNSIIHWKEENVTEEYINYYILNNPYIRMLFEADEETDREDREENREENKTTQDTEAGRGNAGIDIDPPITSDIDPTRILGTEIETHTEGKKTTKLKIFEGNIIEAIDGYIRMSIPVVQKLIKAICGQQGFKNSNSFEAMIGQLLSAGEGAMLDWLEEEDTVLNKLSKNGQEMRRDKQEKSTKAMRRIAKLYSWYSKKTKYIEFVDFIDNKKNKSKEFQKLLDEFEESIDSYYDPVSSLDEELMDLLGKKYNTLKTEFIDIKTDESESMNIDLNRDSYYKPIYENATYLEDEEIFESLKKNLDVTYNKVRNYLGEQMGSAINSDPKDWQIITDSKTRMEELKKAADAEIKEKINLICRLAGEGKTDLGDKFKSAISKHPIRAESLKRIWAMYSDDLSDRMETRIRSITGDNGNSNILTTIKQFLINVYPNLMAAMLYYRQVFFLIESYTKRYPLSAEYRENLKQLKELEKAKNEYELTKQISQVPDTPIDSSTAVTNSSTAVTNLSTAVTNSSTAVQTVQGSLPQG